MNIILFGAPGSGKGTLSNMLEKELGVVHISTGDMFRSEIASDTELGRNVKGYLDSGSLVPDEIVIGVIKERLSNSDTKKGVLFDGFPRTVFQAKALDKICSIDKVILIEITPEAVIKRLTTRRMCKQCQKITNLRWLVNGKCEKCGGEVYQRDDDKEEVIIDRLKNYEMLTKPLAEYYTKACKLLMMEAKQEVSDNLKDALALINKKS
ncbi:MAG: adenylate kinase [Christensenellaceae bacterium]|nr:adenylate kinase [Christensenellaceae bacterium]